MSNGKFRARVVAGTLALLAVAGGAAAQMSGQGPRGAAGFGPSVGGSFGVPSKPARMISPGGQGGLPINRTNTLLPPDAGLYRPRPIVCDTPRENPLGGSSSGLVRPIFGPGPLADGGTPYGTGGGLYANAEKAGLVGRGAGSGYVASGASYSGGSSIRGCYNGDKWNICFRLGSGVGYGGYHKPCSPCGPYAAYCSPCSTYPLSWYGNYWYGYNSYPYYPQTIYSGPWYGTDPFLTQAQALSASASAQPAASASQAAPAELTAVERAELAWRAGQTAESVRWFREHLAKDPADADAMRYLALVLIDDRKIEQAVALMGSAYAKDPKLASKPLPLEILPEGAAGQRRRLNAISTYANRVKTGSAWLTLAVLMQSERRDDVAARMVRRAREAGGSPAVLDELDLSLRN